MKKEKLTANTKYQIKNILLAHKNKSLTEVNSLLKYVESGNAITLKRVENILARLLIGNVYWHVDADCEKCYLGKYVNGQCESCGTHTHPGWVNVRTNASIPHNLNTLEFIFKREITDPKINYRILLSYAENGSYRFLNGNLYKWTLSYFAAIGDVEVSRSCVGLVSRLSNRGIPFDHIPQGDMLYIHMLSKELLLDNAWAWDIKHRVVGPQYKVNKKIASITRGPSGNRRFSVFNDTHYNKILRRAGHSVS